jgi:hypothetical protein
MSNLKTILKRLDCPVALALLGASTTLLGAALDDFEPAVWLLGLAGVNAMLVGQTMTVFLLLLGAALPGRAGALFARFSRRRVELAARALVRAGSVLLGASAAAASFAGVSWAALQAALNCALMSGSLLFVARQLRQYAALRDV